MVDDFTLKNSGGELFHLHEHLPLVLYFYPKDNTPGCTLEAQDFSHYAPEFKKLGYEVAGISRDSVTCHQKFRTQKNLTVELLADSDELVCRQFDVIKEKNMYGKKVMGIERSTFILDKNGQIIQEYRKIKAPDHALTVLQFLRARAA